MATGTHACLEDERNASVLVNVNGELLPRKEATVSVFDAGFLLGDGIWEGLRLHKGKFAFLPEHLQRLVAGAAAIGLELPLTLAELEGELYRTVAANGMEDGAHVRLVVSRGPKATPFQDPRASAGGPTLVIIPEWKTPDPALYTRGIALVSVATRRPGPEVQDPRINSLSKHNCIQACREAAALGGDEGIMLDPHGNTQLPRSGWKWSPRQSKSWRGATSWVWWSATTASTFRLAPISGWRSSSPTSARGTKSAR